MNVLKRGFTELGLVWPEDTPVETALPTDTTDFQRVSAKRIIETGSGEESQQYLDLHYCEPCDEYIDTPGEAEVHARDSHDYDPLMSTSLPKYIHGERSMSVGDVVQDREQDEYHMAQPIGFEEIEVLDEDRGETL